MHLESELKNEQVSHLNLSDFSRVESGTSVRDALAQLRAERHYVCLITNNGHLVGIFTARDARMWLDLHPEFVVERRPRRDPYTDEEIPVRVR